MSVYDLYLHCAFVGNMRFEKENHSHIATFNAYEMVNVIYEKEHEYHWLAEKEIKYFYFPSILENNTMVIVLID